MKQPELGKKIAELRKSRNLTQEELVEKCYVSVRTIQRIESGEVTPRHSTVKMILTALDSDIEDFKKINSSLAARLTNPIKMWFENILFIDFEVSNVENVKKQLKIAWIAGLAYFIVAFIEAVFDYIRVNEVLSPTQEVFYFSIKILALLSFILFQRGFIIIGEIFHNYLIKISSYFLMFTTLAILGYDIVSVFYDVTEQAFLIAKGAQALTFGGVQIIFGVALIRLQDSMGRIARYAGIFEIIAGCLFVSVILSFMGLVMLVPAEILEILLLYKGYEFIKKQNNL